MEKINIAEILKSCPNGMELDSTMYNYVTLIHVLDDNAYPIKIKTPVGQLSLDKYGQYFSHDFAKCVIFPKGKTTWEGFVPPCKFEDGNIVATSKGDYVFILKKVISYRSNNICDGTCYCAFGLGSKKLLTKETNWYFSRLATEEEKAELFKAIKENGYKWNEETKKLEKVSQYPQTFEECCTVLGLTELGIIGGYRHGLLTQFRNLLICRDAYWKIADDWKFNFEEKCYYLCNEYHEIQDFNGVCDCNAVLAFPTAEMRDVFYDNFEELIKECKSLL